MKNTKEIEDIVSQPKNESNLDFSFLSSSFFSPFNKKEYFFASIMYKNKNERNNPAVNAVNTESAVLERYNKKMTNAILPTWNIISDIVEYLTF